MALNIPAMQIQADPVGSYREGHAYRAAMAADRQQATLRDQQIEMNRLDLESARAPKRPGADQVIEELSLVRDLSTANLGRYESEKESLGEDDARSRAARRSQENLAWLREAYPHLGQLLPKQVDDWDPESVRGSLKQYEDLLGQAGGGELVNLIPPGATDLTGRRTLRRDDAIVDELIGQGWTRVGAGNPTGTPDELLGGMTKSQAGELVQERSERNRIAVETTGEILIALAGINGISVPSGFGAKLGELFGGIAGQVNEDLGNEVSQLFTGADTADLATVRTQAKALVARLLPSITGEDSGRYTEAERGFATEVEGALDLAQNKTQVMSNMTELVAMELRGMYRDARWENQGDYPFDLNDDADIEKLNGMLAGSGIEQDRIFDILNQLLSIQEGRIF